MIVRPASRIDSAISFGVFWRLAPSTRAIIRSRNVSPGLAVMRTTIRSDSTRVPPVTAERSPPDSRITGADSPVMADSSTEAMPSMTSPSEGITSPGDDDALVADVELGSTAPARCCRRLGGGWRSSRCGSCAATPPGPCRGPRPSPRRSWRTARWPTGRASTRPAKTFSLADGLPKSRTNRIVV